MSHGDKVEDGSSKEGEVGKGVVAEGPTRQGACKVTRDGDGEEVRQGREGELGKGTMLEGQSGEANDVGQQ